MSTQLDIDDVCAGNQKAMQELADMRERIEQLKNAIEDLGNRYDECIMWATGSVCEGCRCSKGNSK